MYYFFFHPSSANLRVFEQLSSSGRDYLPVSVISGIVFTSNPWCLLYLHALCNLSVPANAHAVPLP